MLLSNIFKRTVQEHFLYAKNLSELSAIQSPDLNLTIYERKPGDELQASVEQLMKSSFKGIELLLQLNLDVKEQVKSKLITTCSQDDLALDVVPLLDDIESLVYLFSNICKAESLKLHLKTVANDACAKFHIDGYDLRLLCTYEGKGTEWTYNDNVNRKHLGLGENEQIIKNWGFINRMNAFDVAILKGEIPTRKTGKGIVHRSPPIHDKNEKRLLLRIDF